MSFSDRLGDEQPGERGVLELADVAERVTRREVELLRPGARLSEPAMRDQHSRSDRGDRVDVRREVAEIEPLGLVKQRDRAIEITLCLEDASLHDPGSVGIPREGELVAQAASGLEVRPGLVESAALVRDVGEAGVHVRRAAERRFGTGGEREALLVDPHRVAEPALRQADVGADDRTAHQIGDVARLLELAMPSAYQR